MDLPEMPTADRPPRTTRSADGTTIAFDVYGDGDGPLVVLVSGATVVRLFEAGLARALAERGCVAVAYDRRGRGDSSDTQPYAVDRELEDLAAVVRATRPNGRAVLFGHSSGAALALRAGAEADLPVERVVAFEPPYRLPGSPPGPPDYTATLSAFNEAGDGDGAVVYFQTQAVGLSQDMVDGMRGTPLWDLLVSVAPTLLYDAHVLGGDDHRLPTQLSTRIEVPVLTMASAGSPDFLRQPAEQLVSHLPHSRFQLVPGDFHTAPDAVLADTIAAFADAAVDGTDRRSEDT